MSKPFHVVIIGGGPGGLATALSLAQHPSCSTSRARVTVLELRDTVQTIGGAINLTPLALRYLDSLGAGKRLRPRGSPVSAIELVAHRTGRLLGQLWPGVDALRVQRQYLVESLLAALREETDSKLVTIEYGARVVDIEEYGDANNATGGVRVVWSKAGSDGDRHVIDADLVVGADGIHSQVRSFFDANREKTYSGKCVAYGFIRTTPEEAAQWKRADGQPLVTDTTLVQHGSQSLLVTYYQAQGERDGLYLAAVMPVEDASPANGGNGAASSREGWSVRSADKAGLKRDIAAMFSGGSLSCLEEIIGRCGDWFFYPVYMLPPDGTWSSGRLQLIGDAAHAVSVVVEICASSRILTWCNLDAAPRRKYRRRHGRRRFARTRPLAP